MMTCIALKENEIKFSCTVPTFWASNSFKSAFNLENYIAFKFLEIRYLAILMHKNVTLFFFLMFDLIKDVIKFMGIKYGYI